MQDNPTFIDIDTVVDTLSRSVFAPTFCLVVLLAVSVADSAVWHPFSFVWTVWTSLVIFYKSCQHLSRIYASRALWWFHSPKLKWARQIVVITGGGSGIGALLAETVAKLGARVVVLTKDAPTDYDDSSNVETYICDVSDYDQVMDVARRVGNEVGDPTIIVNNAGIVKGKLLLDLTKEDVQETFGANTLAQFWILKAFLPVLIRRGTGHVVTMSSVLGLVGAPQMTDYCASKAALISLHQALRLELDSRFRVPMIHTTLVLPSLVRTSLFDKTQLPDAWWFRFLAPPLQPHTVVKAIADALEHQESRVIRLPFYSNLARFMGSGIGIMPKWLSDLLQQLSGANFSMQGYGPKPDAAELILDEKAGHMHE